MLKKTRRGFTLVEISLFLAVTGLLFFGIVAGVQGSMFQQRYNDSVQSFAEFLRSIYSQTSNVENSILAGGGRSDKAIYGKLVTFGEKYDLEGKTNSDKAIFSYTVIGDADGEIGTGSVLEELSKIKASVFIDKETLAGIADQYFPRWMAGIETTKGPKYEDFKGAILVVRHPNSGTVFTFVLEGETIEINEMKKSKIGAALTNEILNKFSIKDVDFCVNPEPGRSSNMRRDIRIIAGARNASGVEIIGQNDTNAEVGNRCK